MKNVRFLARTFKYLIQLRSTVGPWLHIVTKKLSSVEQHENWEVCYEVYEYLWAGRTPYLWNVADSAGGDTGRQQVRLCPEHPLT
jgi:hypothetical protein